MNKDLSDESELESKVQAAEPNSADGLPPEVPPAEGDFLARQFEQASKRVRAESKLAQIIANAKKYADLQRESSKNDEDAGSEGESGAEGRQQREAELAAKIADFNEIRSPKPEEPDQNFQFEYADADSQRITHSVVGSAAAHLLRKKNAEASARKGTSQDNFASDSEAPAELLNDSLMREGMTPSTTAFSHPADSDGSPVALPLLDIERDMGSEVNRMMLAVKDAKQKKKEELNLIEDGSQPAPRPVLPSHSSPQALAERERNPQPETADVPAPRPNVLDEMGFVAPTSGSQNPWDEPGFAQLVKTPGQVERQPISSLTFPAQRSRNKFVNTLMILISSPKYILLGVICGAACIYIFAEVTLSHDGRGNLKTGVFQPHPEHERHLRLRR